MKYILQTGLLLASLSLQAQSLERVVMSPAGGAMATPGWHLEYTLGEAIVGTVQSGTFTLNQGFNQTNPPYSTSIEESFAVFVQYRIYPNPTQDWLSLHLEAEKPIDIKAEIWDMRGRHTQIEGQRWQRQQEIDTTFDLSTLGEGTYLLRLSSLEGKLVKSLRIVKQ
ncbi:MAG: T9SS type A sorting domain-containing protein [Bacteroidota bacterium]